MFELTNLLHEIRSPPIPIFADGSGAPYSCITRATDVIDYYSLPDDADGNPVFSLDVRPALDSPAAVQERVAEWWRVKKETWLGLGTATDSVPGVRVTEDK